MLMINKGDWVQGLRQGKGKMKWRQSGQEFEGEFYAGMRHGFGTHKSTKAPFSFEGEVVMYMYTYMCS
jgi:hypothetical protein